MNEGPSAVISALSHDKVRLGLSEGSGLLVVLMGVDQCCFSVQRVHGLHVTLLMEVPRDGSSNFSDHFLPLCFGLCTPCSLAVINSQDRRSEKPPVRVARAAERHKNSSETKDHMLSS